MPYTRNRVFDDVAKLMTDAAGAAQGLRRDVETVLRSQVERFLREFDIPNREEVEAIREMARLAREENDELKRRLDELERRHGGGSAPARHPASTPAASYADARSEAPEHNRPRAT